MATYYVATNGNNGWPGTFSQPWRNITYAESQINAGDTVYVRTGTYTNRLTINSSGSSGNLRTFEAYQSETVILTNRIVINGNYNKIDKFEFITTGSPSGSERELTFYGDRNVANNLYFHDATTSSLGIRITGGNYNTINNSVEINAGSIYIDNNSDYNVFDGGEIGYCWSMLCRVGGIGNQILNIDMHNPGQVGTTGNEADGFNLHGFDHVIRGCKIHRCFREDPDQHVDAIQWWGTVGNFTIENNIIGSYDRGGYANEKDAGHIQFEGYSDNMKIRNNVFLDSQYPYVFSSSDGQTHSADNWEVTGNIFRSTHRFRADLSNALYWTLKNNVFYWDGQTLTAGGTYDVDHNCYVNASKGPYDGPGTIEVSDAGFIDDSVGSGNDYGLDANWHLESDSPLIDAANSDTGTTLDADGNPRVDDPSTPNTGTGTYDYYDIGRYEYQVDVGIEYLAGSSGGVSTASAKLNVTKSLGGQSDGGSTASASVHVPGIQELEGQANGTSTAGVALTVMGDVPLAGVSNGVSTAIASVSISSGEPSELNVGASADTVIRANAPDQNFGSATNMQVHKNVTEAWGRVLLTRFDFSAVDQGATIESANLGLYCYNDQASGVTLYARHLESVGNAFTEGGVTFNEYDGSNSWDSGAFSAADWTEVNQATDVSTGSSHWFIWDITDMIQHALDNHSGIIELAIATDQASGNYWYFYTKEYGTEAQRPYLDITYSGGEPVYKTLAGQSDGSSTVGASVGIERTLAGTSNGTSTAGATVDLAGRLAGVSDGSSTAEVAGINLTKKLAGASDGLSLAYAKIAASLVLAGTSNGLSTAEATISYDNLAGRTDGTSTVTGTLTVVSRLIGQSDGSSTAKAKLYEEFTLAATSELFRTW